MFFKKRYPTKEALVSHVFGPMPEHMTDELFERLSKDLAVQEFEIVEHPNGGFKIAEIE